ncbi:hypothetical protein NW768_002366 [Fusarium equiseti]|uniref:WSC domain-containing protein n=1 Tax=Fusarium equiseti TaxID=61235 RepID=A0ABQ8RNP2_FUSEQ|nr:hypothetical protein NW768_002366 [Fusarium equiseti]
MIFTSPASIALWTITCLATALPGPLRPGQQHPIQSAALGRISQQGCFSSIPITLGSPNSSSQNSWDSCSKRCRDEEHKPVALVRGRFCYCADTYPPIHTLMEDERCDDPCPGFGFYACGSTREREYYTVTNTGLELDPGYAQHQPMTLRGVERQPAGLQRYLGCYAGLPKEIGRHGRVEWNSPRRCHELCKEGNKRYLIMSENICHCTDVQAPSEMQVSDEKCNEKCRDTGDSCGGYDAEGRQSVYSTCDTSLSKDDEIHKDEYSSASFSTVVLSPAETTTWTSYGLSQAINKDEKTSHFAPSEIVSHIYQLIGTSNAYWQYLSHQVGWFEPKDSRSDGKDLDL